jgi:fibronectin-binding autotransporter adhesin
VMSASGGLVKVGAGTLTLSGANTFSGGTTVNAGVLQLGNANAVQNSTVAVNVDGGLAFSPSVGMFTLGGLAGSNNFALTDTAVDDITLRVGNDGASTTYSGIISGTGSLTKIGAGTLTLNGANTFSGAMTIVSGALTLANSNALQDSTVVISGGQLSFSTASTHSYTFGGLAGSGNVGLGLTQFGNFVDLSVGNNNGDSTFSGSFGGAGEMIKIGTGTLTLTGTNSSFVSIQGGAVRLGSATTLANSGVGVGVDGGLKFSPGIGTFSIGSLNGANNFSLTDTAGAGVTLQITAPFGFGAGNGTATYSGAMSGNGALTLLIGSQSTQVLKGVNSYIGGTTVTSGTLATVSGGVIGLGALTINPTGTASAVSSAGTSQSVANLTVNAAATATAAIDVTSGATLTVTGATNVQGGTLNKTSSGTLAINGSSSLATGSGLAVTGGRMRINATGSSVVVGGVTASVASGAMLELDGTTSALASGANRVNIVNSGNLNVGNTLVTPTTVQQVGGIDGTGTTTVQAKASLTANHIVQTALVIGGIDATHRGLVTIAASDASGNPLASSGALAVAGSLAASDPFVSGAGGSTSLAAAGNASAGNGTGLGGTALGGGSSSAVPEPSSLALVVLAALAGFGLRFRNRRRSIR